MRAKNIYTILIVALLLTACNRSEPDVLDTKVALNAEVEEMIQNETRSEIGGSDIHTSASVTGMKAAVWFSSTNGVYPESNPQSPTFLPYRANLTYDDGPTIVYTNPTSQEDPICYSVEDNSSVYCVSLYPQTGWTTNDDNTTATHIIDGKQDLMFAPQISGKLLDKMPKQTYSHLLPWVRFTVRAVNPESATNWGKITSVQLVDGKGTVTITLGTGAIAYSPLAQDGNIDVISAPFDLTVAIQDIGSTLCMPAEESYKLKIVTDKGYEKELTINQKFEAGKLYLVNLYFNSLNDINAVCSLVPWNEENVIL